MDILPLFTSSTEYHNTLNLLSLLRTVSFVMLRNDVYKEESDVSVGSRRVSIERIYTQVVRILDVPKHMKFNV